MNTLDSLHSMLSTIRTETRSETKSETKSETQHLSVFREFLAHLDRIQRVASPAKSLRTKAQPRRKTMKRATG